jgi:hypothetical protein
MKLYARNVQFFPEVGAQELRADYSRQAANPFWLRLYRVRLFGFICGPVFSFPGFLLSLEVDAVVVPFVFG